MQPLPPAPRRGTRLALVGGSLFALLGVVAFATRSGFGGRSASAAPSVGLLSWLFSVGLVLTGVAILASIYVFIFMTGRGDPQKRKSFAKRVAQGLAFLALALVVATFIVYARGHSGGFRLPTAGLGKPPGTHGRVASGSPRSIGFEWPVLLFAVAVPLIAWLFARRRRTGRALLPSADAALAAVVAESISDAIDDLEAEPDARRAVIAAYARMEGVLARHDLRRTPGETPLEYLRRVLLGLSARGDAVQALTGLFEEARFSRHEIDSSMKRDAIGALRAIRDDLQSAGA